MKFNFKAIRFNLWLSFFFFAVLVLVLVGSFQFLLIRPHFRTNKTNEVKKLAEFIEIKVIKNNYADDSDFNQVFKSIIDNDVCVIVLNKNGKVVYFLDSLGEICVFNDVLEYNNELYSFKNTNLKVLELLEKGELNLSYNAKNTNKEMFLYGKKIIQNYEDFNLIINSPLEPVDSFIKFITGQYLFFTFVVIIISLLFAYFLASKFSKPLITMKYNAEILALGNYQNAKFDGGFYSEYQILADALNDATNKLAKIDTLRKEFLANISHDIKTPLTMIEAYSEMIKDISGDIPEKRKEHLEIIIGEAKYLDKLVTDLLELSQLQSKTYILKKENFELNELILEITKNYQALLQQKNLSFKFYLIPGVVYADRLKITQVINNYLSNAIKYSFNDGEIRVRIIDLKDRYRVTISDDGDGIPLHLQPYVWDRYYKIDKNFKRDIKQTGLGLAIVKAIIEAHGGKYGLKSKQNQGSEFYFELFKEVVVKDEIG